MMGPKSNQFIDVKYPHSMDTLSGLLEVLKDPKKFAEQIKALQDYMDQAKKTIETLAKAEEIDGLLADTKQKHAIVSDLHDKAQTEADFILAKANEDATVLKAKAQNNILQMTADATAAKEQALADAEKAKEAKAKYTALLNEAITKEAELLKRETAVKVAEDEINRKRAILAQLGG